MLLDQTNIDFIGCFVCVWGGGYEFVTVGPIAAQTPMVALVRADNQRHILQFLKRVSRYRTANRDMCTYQTMQCHMRLRAGNRKHFSKH